MFWLLVVMLAGSDVDAARAHLAAGKLDDVLFALDGKTVPQADRPKAALVLANASTAALEQKDALFALQFAQMALSYDPAQTEALESAARASFSQQQFSAAEGYADRWILADPKSGSARLLRAQLAVEAGEWDVAVDQLDQAKLTGSEAAVAKQVRMKAAAELKDKKLALSTVASLERRLTEAAVQAKRQGARPFPAATAPSTGITVYTTSWCGYCKQAKAFLKRKGVDFVERDVEKDPGAAEELAQKAAAAGVQARGVPVIDVRGKLMVGYDERQLAAQL